MLPKHGVIGVSVELVQTQTFKWTLQYSQRVVTSLTLPHAFCQQHTCSQVITTPA